MEQPSWDAPLPAAAAAAKLRALLHDVDSCSTPLWTGRPLRIAMFRYTEIFLPMLAAYLHRVEAIKLTGAALERSDALVNSAARKLKGTLKRVEGDPIYKKCIIEEEDRQQYIAPFLPLGRNTTPHAVYPIPPLDVAFCWALHRLSPLDYERDCIAMFGVWLPGGGSAMPGQTANGLDYVSVDNANELKSLTARLQWSCFSCAVRTMEHRLFIVRRICNKSRKTFLPVYLWPRFKEGLTKTTFPCNDYLSDRWVCPIAYDLEAAAKRQKQFLYNIRSPYYEEDSSLIRGAERYKKFLELMRDNKGMFLVPMYDIDLVWHAHILRSSVAYARDCWKFVGRFINHTEDDDRTDGGELQNGFKRTVQLWMKTYGEEYADSDTNYKGKISDKYLRVFAEDRSNIVSADNNFRAEFVKNAVCEECSTKKGLEMHKECRKQLRKTLRLARGGQAMGGACGGLYGMGFLGSTTYYAAPGGACGGLLAMLAAVRVWWR